MKRDFPRWFNLISILIIMGLSFVIVSCNSVTPSASRTPSQITADTLKEGEAVIDILTENETKILPEMMGVHNQITRQNYVINSNDFLKAAENFGRLGFIRWSGGTTNKAFNWKPSTLKRVTCLPLFIEGIDSAPCTVIAEW